VTALLHISSEAVQQTAIVIFYTWLYIAETHFKFRFALCTIVKTKMQWSLVNEGVLFTVW